MSGDAKDRDLPQRIARALDALPQDEAIAARLAKARRQALQAAAWRDRLEDEASQIGPELQARLRAARRAAVEWVATRSRRRVAPGFAWAGAAAAAALVAAVLLPSWISGDDVAPLYQSEDEELVVEEMELLEDMEFIAWLEAEQPGAGSDSGSADRAG